MALDFINRLFEKRGITAKKELSKDEKETFERWEAILSRGEITVDTIREFCENQVRRIGGEFKNLENSKDKNERLINQFVVYSTLLATITAPATEKEALEKYLEKLITE